MYPEQPDFETPYLYGIDNTADGGYFCPCGNYVPLGSWCCSNWTTLALIEGSDARHNLNPTGDKVRNDTTGGHAGVSRGGVDISRQEKEGVMP